MISGLVLPVAPRAGVGPESQIQKPQIQDSQESVGASEALSGTLS